MTWHIIEAHFPIGDAVLHADVGPALPDVGTARAAVRARLEQVRHDHPEDPEALQASELWAAGEDEVYIGIYTWTVIEPIPSGELATRTYLQGLAKSYTEAGGLDLTIAEPNFLG